MSPVNECIPFFEPATRVTCHAAGALTGKRLVKVSGAISGGIVGFNNVNVVACTAGAKALGVAVYDAASGEETPVIQGPGTVVPITAGAALTAGQEVMSDAQGRVIPWVSAANEANRVVGIVLDDTANGVDAPVRLYT